MRELTMDEIEQVSGGTSPAGYAAEGASMGSFAGALATRTLYGATRGGGVGALLGMSYGLGYEAGSRLYDYLS